MLYSRNNLAWIQQERAITHQDEDVVVGSGEAYPDSSRNLVPHTREAELQVAVRTAARVPEPQHVARESSRSSDNGASLRSLLINDANQARLTHCSAIGDRGELIDRATP